MSTFVVADTHGTRIEFESNFEDLLIHLGDWERGEIKTKAKKILISGNHDMFSTNEWDFVCDGLLLDHIWYTHEPAERMPKGSHYNICGHLHDNDMNDFGYEKKPWHIVLPANEILDLEKVLWEKKHL